ncbi:MAG: dihydroorotate dehydrogenase-like protein [Cyclobacteriaceae bacterium]|nr:dihydroorotate dehydrogenase-like protein [Cyclobacteriaceae bacterium]
MNLETTLMGLHLHNPIIVGSSSLTATVKNVELCEEAGAGAVVLKSLYEEQILADSQEGIEQDDMYQWYPEAMEYVRSLSAEHSVDQYLDLIVRCKKSVKIPVIASINCYNAKKWVDFASEVEKAGADALELNISIFPENERQTALELETRYYDIVSSIKTNCSLPLSVKLNTYFTNIKLVSTGILKSGASSLVLFNRYYRPDIDIDNLHMTTRDALSGPEEITQSLRWVGLLSKRLNCEIVASTGIHDASGIIKQILAGAMATQVCSVLYENGISYIGDMISDIRAWMKRKGFNKIEDFRGYINKDPHNTMIWERIHYMKKSSGDIIKPILN